MSKVRSVQVPEGYHCPFCPNYDDEDFVIWERLLLVPICDSCAEAKEKLIDKFKES